MNLTHLIKTTTFRLTLVVKPMFEIGPALKIIASILHLMTKSCMYVLEPKVLHRLFVNQCLLSGSSKYKMSILKTIIKSHCLVSLFSSEDNS